MADLQSLLGVMLSNGLGNSNQRGLDFLQGAMGPGASPQAVSGSGGRFMKTAGIASLAYLAYRAYQEYQGNRPQQTGAGGTTSAGSAQGSLLDKLTGLFGGLTGGHGQPAAEGAPPAWGAAPPEAGLDDRRALLLIRAMIAAAAADGEIDAEERRRIVGKLDEAGAGPEERALIERELAAPVPLDTLLRQVDDPALAEQFYLASALAIDADTEAERAYLSYLATRLRLDPQRAESLSRFGG